MIRNERKVNGQLLCQFISAQEEPEKMVPEPIISLTAPMQVREQVNPRPHAGSVESGIQNAVLAGEHSALPKDDTVYNDQRQEHAQRIVERFRQRPDDELYYGYESCYNYDIARYPDFVRYYLANIEMAMLEQIYTTVAAIPIPMPLNADDVVASVGHVPSNNTRFGFSLIKPLVKDC